MSLKYNDLQPWVEMLCDAVENKGASSSGSDHGAYACAQMYRDLLHKVRTETISPEELFSALEEIRLCMVEKSNQRQQYRLNLLADAIHKYFLQELFDTTREWRNGIRTSLRN